MTVEPVRAASPSNYAATHVALVTREARLQGREDALGVIKRLRDEAECSCLSCIREELEKL